MKATIKEAENNARYLRIQFNGYGHYKIEADIRGKRKSCITTDSRAVDDFNSEFGEKDERTKENLRKRGYETLINEIIYSNKEY